MKEQIIKILSEADYKGFVNLHPKIWNSEFKLGDTFIYPIDVYLTLKQIETIKSLTDYPCAYVIVWKNSWSGDIQVFFTYHNGTNGLEGNIINSMKDCTKVLEKINNHPDVEWTTILDTLFDTCDDVYSWWITFTLK